VRFSDGEPFNADTVKANIEYIMKKENNSVRRVRIGPGEVRDGGG